jgi:hypothetical protein
MNWGMDSNMKIFENNFFMLIHSTAVKHMDKTGIVYNIFSGYDFSTKGIIFDTSLFT